MSKAKALSSRKERKGSGELSARTFFIAKHWECGFLGLAPPDQRNRESGEHN